MADIFGTPVEQIIFQGTQLLQGSIRARQQLEFQREQFAQNVKEHSDNLKLRQENLELERQKLELDKQMATAKLAAGGEGPSKTDLEFADVTLQRRAAEDAMPVVEGDAVMAPFKGWTLSQVERREAELLNAETNMPATAQFFQQAINSQERMPPGVNSPRGQQGRIDNEKAALRRYRQVLGDFTERRRKASGIEEQAMRQAGLPTPAAEPAGRAAPPPPPVASGDAAIRDAVDKLVALPPNSKEVEQAFLLHGRQLMTLGLTQGVAQMTAVLKTKIQSEEKYNELRAKVLRPRRIGETE